MNKAVLPVSLNLAAWITLAIAVGVPLFALPVLPDEIPRHYDLAGNVDAMGSKWVILTLPGISLFVYGLISAFQRGAPHFAQMNTHLGKPAPNIDQLRLLLQAIKACTMAVFAILGGRTVSIALEHPDLVPHWAVWIPVALIILVPLVTAMLTKNAASDSSDPTPA